MYLVSPEETTPKNLDDAPDYVAMIIPYFFVLILAEAFICYLKSNKFRFRFNDGIVSMSHAATIRVFGKVIISHNVYNLYTFMTYII